MHGCCIAGPQLDVPQDVTVQQLNTLLNGLLQNEEKLPYSFFVEEQELASTLGEHLHKNKVCTFGKYNTDIMLCLHECLCKGQAEYHVYICNQ